MLQSSCTGCATAQGQSPVGPQAKRGFALLTLYPLSTWLRDVYLLARTQTFGHSLVTQKTQRAQTPTAKAPQARRNLDLVPPRPLGALLRNTIWVDSGTGSDLTGAIPPSKGYLGQASSQMSVQARHASADALSKRQSPDGGEDTNVVCDGVAHSAAATLHRLQALR